MNQPQRLFVDAETGERYRVRLSRRERNGTLGVDMRLNALVFETPQGRWIGSVPLYYTEQFERLTDSDLAELLHQAIARG